MAYCCIFFCKQKTAYEIRISDWSSDVCSSDLRPSHLSRGAAAGRESAWIEPMEVAIADPKQETGASFLNNFWNLCPVLPNWSLVLAPGQRRLRTWPPRTPGPGDRDKSPASKISRNGCCHESAAVIFDTSAQGGGQPARRLEEVSTETA